MRKNEGDSMERKLTKILNRTDLAKSGSHGGLVVTKNIQKPLAHFFESPSRNLQFRDERDGELFPIHYEDYTSNGTTPNDRVTPIGRYASKYNLQPGEHLIFRKVGEPGAREYYIGHDRRPESIYFVGKSRARAEVLDNDKFTGIMSGNRSAGKVSCPVPGVYEMRARYEGETGTFEIRQKTDCCELFFNGTHVEESKKYFEMDTHCDPFVLRKTDTWKMEVDMDPADTEADDAAEQSFIREMAEREITTGTSAYVPRPEKKKPGRSVRGRTVPDRDGDTAAKALERAGYRCEYDLTHPLFERRKQRIPYTEAHHLIPLRYDCLFDHSLDVQANIVSLCSHCHNLIHYGADAETVIRKLWNDRGQEIWDAGIGVMKDGMKLTVEMLLDFYGIK